MISTDIESGIFREYDLRGIYGEDLTLHFAARLGLALGSYLKERSSLWHPKISVGRDVRLSSDALRQALIDGLTGNGVSVVDVGICPTPLLYYSISHLGLDGGVMITGSHNPPQYNGFKVCAGKETIFGKEIQTLKGFYKNAFEGSGGGDLTRYDIVPAYIDELKKDFGYLEQEEPIKVALDPGNGTAGLVTSSLIPELGCDVVTLYGEPDGRFPNHHPDPTVLEYLTDLRKTVTEESCDFGVAYDGDADRIGIIDEKGEVIWGDKLMILFAREMLKNQPGATFVGEVKCSQLMYDEIEKLGGRALMWKTGHSLMKKKMKEEGAQLAGEMSGHFFFADRYYGYDDAIYTTCRLVELFKSERKARGKEFVLSDLLAGLPQSFYTPEIRVECPEERKQVVLDGLKLFFEAMLENEANGIQKIITIDGLRVVFDDGWSLARASNTQPVLVLRFEATSKERLEELKDMMFQRLKLLGVRSE